MVPLQELIALFTGVPDDNGDWSTTPTVSLPLAYEICRRTDPITVESLHRVIYDDTPPDELDQDTIDILQLAYQRYRNTRQMQGARGL